MDNLPKTMPRRGSFAQRLTQATRNVMRSGSVDNLSGTIAGINIDNQSNSDPHHSITNNPNDFEIGDAIGYGSSATVHMALHKPTGTNVAIKIIDLDMFERNQIDELRRELQIMTLSKHENMLPVYGSFVSGSKLNIITPLVTGGSCLDVLRHCFEDGIDELSIATVLKQCLQGLEYLHRNGHIHRDVKAGNLLIGEDGVVRLADFGVSSSLFENGERRNRRTFVGTPCWMSPEVLSPENGYDNKADIWSLGITAIELATGSAPYARFPPLKVLMMTLQRDPPRLPQDGRKFSRQFRDFVECCLQKDPTKRWSAEKLLQHSFIKQAKGPEFLVTGILQKCPSITSRAPASIPEHNRGKALREKDERYISWDFDHQSDSKPVEEKVELQGTVTSSNPISIQSPPTGTMTKGRFQVTESPPNENFLSARKDSIGSNSTMLRGRFTVQMDHDSDNKKQRVRFASFSSAASSDVSNVTSASGTYDATERLRSAMIAHRQMILNVIDVLGEQSGQNLLQSLDRLELEIENCFN